MHFYMFVYSKTKALLYTDAHMHMRMRSLDTGHRVVWISGFLRSTDHRQHVLSLKLRKLLPECGVN